MQYELMNRLLSLPTSPRWGTFDPKFRACVQELIAETERCVLVDVSNVWRAIRGTVDGNRVRLQDEVVHSFCRPFEGECDESSVRYPMPWPYIAMICDDLPGPQQSLWFVKSEPDVAPGFVLFDLGFTVCGTEVRVDLFDEDTVVIPITRAALALCAARNANWVESGPDRATRRRHPSVAGVRFRHIEIDMGRPKRSEERASGDGHGVPWHHRRGHWAFYGPNKPLFGRKGNDGWFWRPYTEVGDKQYGEIVQDYSVRGTLPTEGAAA